MLIKFMLVGLTGVGVNMAFYVPIINWTGNYLFAAVCAFLAAVTNNFIWNLLWTFKGRAVDIGICRKYITFLTISLANLGVNLIVLYLLVGYGNFNKILAQLSAIGTVSVCNFALNYLITFREKAGKEIYDAARYRSNL
ncbi:GtrA family protein [Lucifera butyrica]|nr:GtrA family protein [Lucifera butyrica]